jgi:hypothetical protein
MSNKLTEKEEKYFDMMFPKSGVVYLEGKPGIAKSAIVRSIADKMGYDYIDVRLSMVDETEVGLYPHLSEVNGMKVVDYAIPRWAIEANERPTIVHFEELNRASLSVRNASLQILLERCIGPRFCFNDNVLMVSSGNLGEEDGTDVEEFDSALNNRLIRVKHDLLLTEWIDNFANKNVIPVIVDYLKSNPEEYYKFNEGGSYATPRSWTFFSDFCKHKKADNIKSILDCAMKCGSSYIGSSITKFIRYCEEIEHISINDILQRFEDVKDVIRKSNRSLKNELLSSLKNKKLSSITIKQLNNVINFLKMLSDDEIASYLIHIVDEENNSKKSQIIFDAFAEKMISIKEMYGTN